MAIAFNSATDGGNNGSSTTSRTFSHTCSSGSDRMLAVAVWGDTGGTDLITGVTYNGVAMTLVDNQQTPGGRWNSLWYLLNPASGANNVVITASSTSFVGGEAADYTGVAQSGQPDATAKDNDLDATITTVADNCWVVMAGYANSAIAAGTNVTSRAIAAEYSNSMIGDSNGVVSPAGNLTMSVGGGSATKGIVMASFAPAGGGGGVSVPMMTFHKPMRFFRQLR